MRIALLTGIFPPDVGGPATHSAVLAEELRDRGHNVTVVSLTGTRPAWSADLALFPRQRPWWFRTPWIILWLFLKRHKYDVVYATGLHLEAAAISVISRRPAIVKIVGDPVWERGRRLALTTEDFEGFRTFRGRRGLRLRLMEIVRDWSLTKATAIVVPSHYLKEVVTDWLPTRAADIRVIPNGVRLGFSIEPDTGEGKRGLIAICVSRLVKHKRIDVLIDAIVRTNNVRLVVVGEGPDEERLKARALGAGAGQKVSFIGGVPHAQVLRLLANADVLLSASEYEGLPHAAIESLVCGTPIVAVGSGGMREVIDHGRNGYIVDDASPAEVSDLLNRLAADRDLLGRLSDGALRAGHRWRFDRTANAVERLLHEVTNS